MIERIDQADVPDKVLPGDIGADHFIHDRLQADREALAGKGDAMGVVETIPAILVQIIYLGIEFRIQLTRQSDLRNTGIQGKKMGVLHRCFVQPVRIQVIDPHAGIFSNSNSGCKVHGRITVGTVDNKRLPVIADGNRAEYKGGMRPHAYPEPAAGKKFIPPPENKGPGSSIGPKPEKGFKRKPLSPGIHVEHDRRAAERERWYQGDPVLGSGDRAPQVKGLTGAVLSLAGTAERIS